MIGLRVCTKCRVPKLFGEFNRRLSKKRVRVFRTWCRSCEIAESTRWREANRERHRALALAWYHAHPQRCADNHRSWVERNRGRANDRAHRRLAHLASVEVEHIDGETIFTRDGWVCQLCLKPVVRGEESLDHIIPISHGGPHTEANVQLAHRRCNSSKGNRVPKLVI